MRVETPRVAKAALDLQVQGLNLGPGTFREQLGGEPTLLLFLRHLG